MVKYIAELGSNWKSAIDNTGILRAKGLISAAARAGCYGAKVQLFKAEELWHSSCQKEIEINKERELPLEWIPKLYKHAHEQGIIFGASIFHERYVKEVNNYLDFYKISSFDIRRESLIKAYLKTNKPLYISLGLAYIDDICILAEQIKNHPNKLVFMHCTSNYPTKLKDCNLKMIRLMKDSGAKGYEMGYSDHSSNQAAVLQAIFNGATTIECHFDYDTLDGVESSYGHCWTETKLAILINLTKQMEIAEGTNSFLENRRKLVERNRKFLADSIDGLRPAKEYRK